DAEIGLSTAAPSGLLVLAAAGDTGAERLYQLERRHGELAETVCVATGGVGAYHDSITPGSLRSSGRRLRSGPTCAVRRCWSGGSADSVSLRCTTCSAGAPPSDPLTGRAARWASGPCSSPGSGAEPVVSAPPPAVPVGPGSRCRASASRRGSGAGRHPAPGTG